MIRALYNVIVYVWLVGVMVGVLWAFRAAGNIGGTRD
jgi:hypothetical protein